MKKSDKDSLASATDVDAILDNAEDSVDRFVREWVCLPSYTEPCEVVTIGELRDILGLRATFDGDPWPTAESRLRESGFKFSALGSVRVMFLRRRDALIDVEGRVVEDDLLDQEDAEWEEM